MPKEFENCRKAGGRIRTKKLSDGKYVKLCFIGGKSFAGETHEYKKVLKKKNA